MDSQFIRIFNLYKNDVYRLSYSYTKSLSDSDDVTQNVFLKLYKHSQILNKNDLEIKKWLIKVTINECKTLFLSTWKKRIIPLTEKEENTLYVDIPNNDVIDVLFQLPKKTRTIIFLYYYENYKIKEISEILNISETNIQTILSRTRKQLKESLKEI